MIVTAALTAMAAAAPAGAFANADAEFTGTARAIETTAVSGAQAERSAAKAEGTALAAQAGSDGSVIRDQTTMVDVDLNDATVKCSAADYSMPMLKVLVPGLAELTVLNHRNTREGAPCVAAGRCSAALGPQNVLKAGAGVDRVPVRVVLKKVTAIDGDVCHVTLVETVATTIRGLAFSHERSQDVAERAAADCR
jgi:hypothetical protein